MRSTYIKSWTDYVQFAVIANELIDNTSDNHSKLYITITIASTLGASKSLQQLEHQHMHAYILLPAFPSSVW
jgi:hypothetical protein